MSRFELQGGASHASLVDAVRHQARVRPDHPALVFLPDGDTEVGRLSYAELDRRARVFAAQLQQQGLQGRAILLMLPSSIYYVVAFVGCLYAGAIPVPGYPPTNSMHAERMAHIVADCNARGAIVATSSALESIGERLRRHFPEGLDCLFIPIDGSSEAEAAGAGWREPALDRGCTAYLQYTSGSTSNPRGVVVTHGNLLSYCESYTQAAGVNEDDVFVTWLPLFHDMGLILGVIQALAVGATIVMMPPLCFLQKPLRWLQAISRYRGTISYAPNFAYELCASALDQALVNALDLSSWAVAGNAAEPVHADTLAKFARRFEPRGYRPAAMNPSYGLAEATLTVTSHPRLQAARVIDVDLEELTGGRLAPPARPERAHPLVSCGRAWLDTQIAIVDPVTHEVCVDGQVGEIWASGSLVAQGYWQRAAETEHSFGARTADGRGPWLRTGDLGVQQDGELYITGRVKDLIIIRGQNHYPQDIEHTMYRAHPALEIGHGAAFPVEVGGQERLVVVQEVRRSQRHKIDGAQVVQAIRAAIADVHGVQVHAVQLLRPASVHITSSGKIQRRACKQSYLAGGFEVLHAWQDDGLAAAPHPAATTADRAIRPSAEAVTAWLVHRIAEMQGLSPAQVTVGAAFTSLGLDSFKLVALSGELSTWLGEAVEPTLLYSHPSIGRLARHLSGSAPAAAHSRPAEPAAEPIAIVGVACRFPKAGSLDAFWQLLDAGGDGITEVPADRWDAADYFQPGPPAPRKAYTKWGGFLDGIDQFDAHFFGISPREASSMDPQQRLLLQTTWHAFEDAGIVPDTLAGSDTGVFVGVMAHDYEMRVVTQDAPIDAYFGTGMHPSILANRLSYFFDLHGPSWTAETACSSSFVALHNARGSLLARECSVAVAAGVNVLLAPEMFVALSQAQMMSPDGRCMSFDARANGYVRSEACAVLVLKRLADAVRDGDRIHGVIAASAVNQDGRSNGITAPNGPAQEMVIQQALATAGLPATAISCVEAHGTGTSLGDPIEMDALKKTYGLASGDHPVLWVGSVKSNIGHTEPVSGLAGLIKVLLALRHERLPRNIHFESLNPHISLQGSRCQVLTQAQPWPRGARPRIAGVSSFGFGGANTHVIVQEPPLPKPTAPGHAPAPRHELLCVSGKTQAALAQAAANLAAFLREEAPDSDRLRSIAHTANARRTHFAHRASVVGRTASELAQGLAQVARGEEGDGLFTGNAALLQAGRTAFLFTGQGAQYAGMGRGLYRGHTLFRQVMDECDEILKPLLGRSLVEGLYGNGGELLDLDQTAHAQPALFAVEFALARVWQSCGVQPDLLIGHSLGEYVAACLAGVFSLEDGLALAAHRGRLMQTLTPPGSMVAIRASAELAGAWLESFQASPVPGVSIAARNTATDFVLSGDARGVAAAAQHCAGLGAHATPLRVTRAFHSALMAPMLDEFARCAQAVRFRHPSIPIVSNVSGTVAGKELARADYWVGHVMAPVRFLAGLQQLEQSGCRTFIEMGPHPVLSAYGRQTVAGARWLPSMRRGLDDELQLLSALAEYHAQGSHVDWTGWAHGREGHHPLPPAAPLPHYPFQTERHWFQVPAAVPPAAVHGARLHPLLGHRIDSGRPDQAWFDNALQPRDPWFIDEHRVLGTPVLPMAGVIETLLAAARATAPQALPEWSIDDLSLAGAVAFDGEAGQQLRTVVQAEAGGSQVSLRRRAAGEADWQAVAGARVRASFEPALPLDHVRLARTLPPRPIEGFYALCARIGLGYGPNLQGLRQLWVGEGESLAHVAATPAVAAEQMRYRIHPAFLDACFHAAVPFMADALAGRPLALVPVQFERLTVHAAMPPSAWVHCRWHGERAPGRFEADLRIADDQGQVVISVQRMQLAQVNPASLHDAARPVDAGIGYYRTAWHPLPAAAAAPLPPQQAWLVACEDPVQAHAWAELLRARGQAVVTVSAARALGFDDTPAHAQLRWHVADDWLALSRWLQQRSAAPRHLLYQAAAGDDANAALSAYEQAQAGFTMLQQLLGAFADTEPGVMLVTLGALSPDAAVDAGERLSGAGLAQSVVSGMAKAVALEFPRCRCVQVDLADHPADADREAALQHYLQLPGSGVLALRDGRCHEARLAGQPRATLPLREVPISAAHTYLVTGGLRGIGLETTRWLIDRGARHLLLVGRSARPDAVPELAAWQAAGVRIELLAADVADETALARALGHALGGLPPLRGVVHSAGITDDAALAQLDWPRFRAVLDPKVKGAWALHRLTQQIPLDFFLLYSSAASLGGNAGQMNYISACAFQDALAHYRRQRGLPATAINWGYWSDTGMAARREMAAHMARIGLAGIETAPGLQALQRIAGAQPVQCGAIAIDWTRFKAAMCTGHPYRFLADVGAPPAAAQASRTEAPAASAVDTERLAALEPGRAREEVLELLLQRAARILRLDDSRRAELRAGFAALPLHQLGFDSLMAVEMRGRIKNELGAEVPLQHFLTGATAADVAELILAQLALRRVATPSAARQDDETLDKVVL